MKISKLLMRKFLIFELLYIIFRLSVTLCYDVRAIEESVAKRFLEHLKVLLSEPETMIIGTEK